MQFTQLPMVCRCAAEEDGAVSRVATSRPPVQLRHPVSKGNLKSAASPEQRSGAGRPAQSDSALFSPALHCGTFENDEFSTCGTLGRLTLALLLPAADRQRMLRVLMMMPSLCTLLGALLPVVNAANILFLSPMTSHSHTHFFHYTIKELSRRGHTVTHWNGLAPREHLANVTFLHSAHLEAYNKRHQIGFDNNNIFKLLLDFPDRLRSVCKVVYGDVNFKRLLNTREKFDAIVVESFMNECTIPLVGHLGAPFIYMSALPPLTWMLDVTCSPMSLVDYPFLGLDFTDEMNLAQRTINTILTISSVYYRDWFVLPVVDRMARHVWSGAGVKRTVPRIKDIERNLSFLITNSIPAVHYPFLKSPMLIEAGGVHLVQPKSLPKDVKSFLDGSGEAGFIVLSFGTILRGSSIPQSTRHTFMSVFARLPQRVLWKWEDADTASGDPVPSNVRLIKWLPPLIDLMAHDNIKLVMTHGGLLTNQEAVWSGVPLIGFPVFGDQSNYVTKAQKDGYALKLDWKTMTEQSLYDAITEIINNTRYKTKALQLSHIVREHVELARPLERIVRSIEHAVKFDGAHRVRPASCNLNVIQRESLDVTFALAGLLLLAIYAAVSLVKRLTAVLFVSTGHHHHHHRPATASKKND